MVADSTGKVIAWYVAVPVLSAGAYSIVSAFWSRLPMPREWPNNGEEISKPHVPLSRASKLACGLCVGSFGLSILISAYLPKMFQWWMCIFALSMVAVAVTVYLDWFRAPGGDRTTFRGRFIGVRPPPFWKNPAYSLRTKVLAGTIYVPFLVLLVWKLVGSNVPENVFQLCFWSAMTLGFMTGFSALYIDKR